MMETWLSTTGMAIAEATTATTRAMTGEFENAHLVHLSDVDDEDTSSTHEQSCGSFLTRAFGSDGAYYTSERWDQYEACFERDETKMTYISMTTKKSSR